MKKIYVVLIAFCMFCFSACGKNNDNLNKKNANIQYHETTEVFSLPLNTGYIDVIGAGDNCIFYECHYEDADSANESKNSIIRQDNNPGSQYDEIILADLVDNNSKKAAYKCDSENERIAVAHENIDEENGIYNVEITVYYESGEKTSVFEAASFNESFEILDLKVTSNERFLLLTEHELIIADNEGKSITAFPDDDLNMHSICSINNSCVGIFAEESDSGKDEIIILDAENGEVIDVCESKLSDICVYSDGANYICYVDGSDFVFYDVTNKAKSDTLKLSNKNIKTNEIKSICYLNDEICLWGYGYSNSLKRVKLIKEIQDSESDSQNESNRKTDELGREILYLYDASDAGSAINQYIDAYNMESDAYNIVLVDTNFDDEADLVKWISQNDDNCPDLMLMKNDKYYHSLIANGYLKDLRELLSVNNGMDVGELSDFAVEKYTVDNHLYALPNELLLESIMIRRDLVNEGYGWSMNDFLERLENNKEMASIFETQANVFWICVESFIDENVDFDNATANFDDGIFADILECVFNLELPLDLSENPFQMTDTYNSYLKQGVITSAGLENLGFFSAMDKCEYALKGYPSCNGETLAYIDGYMLGIVKKEVISDGAFDFFKFYVKFPGRNIDSQIQHGVGSFYTYKEYLNKVISDLPKVQFTMENQFTGQNVEIAYSQKTIDSMYNMILSADLKDFRHEEIEDIIIDELPFYVSHEKSADEICEIIQNRVSVLLKETK